MLEDDAQPNLTPLIDVVFVILIMFIVVAPLLELDRINLAEGPPIEVERIAQVEKQSRLVLHVFSDDTITLNHHPVTRKQLATLLEKAYVRFPDEIPQLYQDKEAKFGTYQEVKNLAAKAGFHQLDVILKPD
ncbi:MAG: ExbD/TolR family protein [Chlamydiales bacterium]